MQTFKSTVKLTPELIAEIQREVYFLSDRPLSRDQYIACSAIAAVSLPVLLLCPIGGLQAIAFLALVLICIFLVEPFIARAAIRIQFKMNKWAFGTPVPTCETWLEGKKIVERVVETGRTKRQKLTWARVYSTRNYIFIQGNQNQVFTFAKSDFTEDELSALLVTLRRLCYEIVQKS